MYLMWSEGALDDRLDILNRIAKDSVEAALRIDVRFEEEADWLVRFPYLGRKGKRPGSRLLPVRDTKYLIAYVVHDDFIEVMRVIHGSQEWAARL
jgi:toxin ParE1/3/4